MQEKKTAIEVKKADLKRVSSILGVELPENCEILVHDLGAEPDRATKEGNVDVVTIRSLGATKSLVSTPNQSPLYAHGVVM